MALSVAAELAGIVSRLLRIELIAAWSTEVGCDRTASLEAVTTGVSAVTVSVAFGVIVGSADCSSGDSVFIIDKYSNIYFEVKTGRFFVLQSSRIIVMRYMRFWIVLLFSVILFAVIKIWFFEDFGGECKKCDIVLITIDSWEFDDSQKIDNPLKHDYFFENAVANSTWALPSYASIYTSEYPAKQKIWRLTDKLNDGSDNFVTKLKEMGYRTSAYSVGPFFQKQWGFGNGFDEFYEKSNIEDVQNSINSKDFSDARRQPDFVWVRLGAGELEDNYQANKDKVFASVNNMLAKMSGQKNIRIFVVGATGGLVSEVKNGSIHVPMYVFSQQKLSVDTQSVFELKDIGKLILGEAEFLSQRNSGKSVVGLSSWVEDEEKIKSFYKSYRIDMEQVLTVRKDEWGEPNFSSSRSKYWHLIKNLKGEYFLYNLMNDKTEERNLFENWSDLPELERSQAIEVVRSIGGDVPEACGVYCGSDEFFK